MEQTSPKLSVSGHQQLKDENARLSRDLENAKKDMAALKLAKAEMDDEVQVQKSIIREAQMAIYLHQQDIQKWIAVAEVYQANCIRCTDALEQLITFAQGVKSEVPALLSQ